MSALAPEAADRQLDTPGNAMRLLEWRVTLAVTGFLVVLASIAWYLVVRQAQGMSGMVTGLGQVGSRMPNDMAAPLFMVMWLTMMVAMMFPTIAPMVLVHRTVVLKRGEGWRPTAGFILGYLSVWTLVGLIPLGAFFAFRSLMSKPAWLPLLAGAAIVFAGVYQFTPWKRTCLRACRTPFSFILEHDFGGGTRSAFLAGVSHGAYCLGCCWALMAVLVVVGLMNLVWMAGLTVVFLAEKNWRHGVALTRVAGTALASLGLVVIVHPELLTWVSGGSPPSATGGM